MFKLVQFSLLRGFLLGVQYKVICLVYYIFHSDLSAVWKMFIFAYKLGQFHGIRDKDCAAWLASLNQENVVFIITLGCDLNLKYTYIKLNSLWWVKKPALILHQKGTKNFVKFEKVTSILFKRIPQFGKKAT